MAGRATLPGKHHNKFMLSVECLESRKTQSADGSRVCAVEHFPLNDFVFTQIPLWRTILFYPFAYLQGNPMSSVTSLHSKCHKTKIIVRNYIKKCNTIVVWINNYANCVFLQINFILFNDFSMTNEEGECAILGYKY